MVTRVLGLFGVGELLLLVVLFDLFVSLVDVGGLLGAGDLHVVVDLLGVGDLLLLVVLPDLFIIQSLRICGFTPLSPR